MRRQERFNQIARDCVHFKGDQPCQLHLRDGAMCRCSAYSPKSSKILLIQLSSPLTIIRSSALVHRLKAQDPNAQITYLCSFPELLPNMVDEPLLPDGAAVIRLQMDEFDVAYNLDMTRKSCAVMNAVHAQIKKGFYFRGGHTEPLDDAALAMYLRSILPNAGDTDKTHPIQQLFQLCSLEYNLEMPHLEISADHNKESDSEGPHIGIVIGPSERSQAKNGWPKKNRQKLIEFLEELGMIPVMLETPAERASIQNRWHDFTTLVNKCDIVVGQWGATMELAWAIGREVVLLQNGFSDTDETNYFQRRCSVVKPLAISKDEGHLNSILPEQVLAAVKERLITRNQKESDFATSATETVAAPALSTIRDQVSHKRKPPG